MIRQATTYPLLVLLLAAAACPAPGARHHRDERRKLTAGHRSHSAARRAAAERPRPWQQDKRPLDADRTGVAGYQAERRTTEGGVALSFGQCLRVVDRYACPLLVHRWRARDIKGGVRLEAEASPPQAKRLRAFVRCHHAFASHDAQDQSCLRQFAPVRATGGYRDGRIWLELVSGKTGRVAALRRGVRALIAEAR